MARGLNKVMIIGNLGADPEMRYTQAGQAVTNFRVAVNRTRRDQQSGQAVEETEWFRCVAFDKLGEIANEFLAKGRAVYVAGRLQSRKYTGNDGVERTTWEIVAGELQLLGGRGDEAGDAGAPPRRRSADDAGGIDPNDPPF